MLIMNVLAVCIFLLLKKRFENHVKHCAGIPGT